MKLKSAVTITGVGMLALEAICFVLAHQSLEVNAEDPALGSMEHMPYLIAAMTIAFVAFFTLLFAFIFFMLRAELKKNVVGMVLLLLAFVLPIVFYGLIF